MIKSINIQKTIKVIRFILQIHMVGGILENQKKDITGNSFFLKK